MSPDAGKFKVIDLILLCIFFNIQIAQGRCLNIVYVNLNA